MPPWQWTMVSRFRDRPPFLKDSLKLPRRLEDPTVVIGQELLDGDVHRSRDVADSFVVERVDLAPERLRRENVQDLNVGVVEPPFQVIEAADDVLVG
jgi:hypothetical protein